MRNIIGILLLGLFFIGCISTPIKNIQENPEDYVGEEVYVEGIAHNTLKIGQLSGFVLTDGNNSIRVSSQKLPEEGKKVMVKGIVIKDSLVGYYILAKEIN